MQHPLVNPSLCPYGFAFPGSILRLKYESPMELWTLNTERLIAKFWDKRHRKGASRPLPVATIIHEIMPGVAARDRLSQGDFVFDGLPYLSRDIALLSSAVQWFATSVGRCFLEDRSLELPKDFHPTREFVLKLEVMQRRRDMVAMFMHIRAPAYRVVSFEPCDNVQRPADGVSERDRAVVDALMRWLGSKAGRTFTADWMARKERAWEAERRRSMDVLQEAKPEGRLSSGKASTSG